MLLPIIFFLIGLILALALGVLALWFLSPDVKWLISTNPEQTAFMRIRDREFKYQTGQKKQIWVELFSNATCISGHFLMVISKLKLLSRLSFKIMHSNPRRSNQCLICPTSLGIEV